MSAGELKEEGLALFTELLKLKEQFKHKNNISKWQQERLIHTKNSWQSILRG